MVCARCFHPRVRRSMVTFANQGYVLGLFSTANTNSNGIVSIDLSGLITAQSNASAAAATAKSAAPAAPTPPWSTQETPKQASANVTSALAGQSIVSGASVMTAPPGASPDFNKLFALYQGLSSLEDVATQASTTKDPQQLKQLANAFSNGLTQVSTYATSAAFSKLRMALGADATSAHASLTIAKPATTYITKPLTTSLTADVPAYDGNVQFNINVKLNNKTTVVPIDLSGMGTQTRSLANVIVYTNQQLAAAGVQTRVVTDRIPGQPQTITAGGTTVTLPPTADQFAMQVNIGTSETVSFSAPQAANAVYIGETVGNPNPSGDPTLKDSDTNAQLLKIQTDTSTVPAPPQITGQGNFVSGQTFSDNLGPNIGTVHATQVGADGSVYMLADVSGTVNGQKIDGTQDTALLKYDSAGKLLYTRTLGASSTATGYSLAVSSTGQVAVSGSVTGELDGTTDGALNSGATGAFSDQTDSFVSLYDSTGNELWTARRGSALQDQATNVAFSADSSTVYVAGQAQGAMPGGGAAIGGYDGYVEGFTTNAKTGAPQATFTQTFGTAGADFTKGMVVDGNTMITASVESGNAVLRNFDLSSGQAVLTSTRDLGSLQGGTIAGLSLNGSGQVVVAGTTANGALNAGTITSAASGGTDAFAAQISESLAASPSDAIAYYGGSGNDHATGLAVSNGQVWITGTAGTDLPNQPAVGKQDGFVANIDIATGAVNYSRRFSGKDGMASPTSIAVDSSGASVLDVLGLPKGIIGGDTSQQLTAQSSLRPGDQFTVAPGSSPPVTITIDQGETLQTLATKIQRASGSEATATVSTSSTGAQQLTVKPAFGNALVTLGAGPANKNALTTLGLPEGVVNQTSFNSVTLKSLPSDGGPKIYGLGLSSTLNLSSAAQISHAQAVIATAMGVVRSAYQDLVAASTPQTQAQIIAATNKSASNPVPTYLTAQLANLQAGLARLTGGNPSSSTSTLA
jgi:hypothetical protein